MDNQPNNADQQNPQQPDLPGPQFNSPPPQGYAPPPQAYPPQGYAPPQGYPPPQGYAPPQGYPLPPGYTAPPKKKRNALLTGCLGLFVLCAILGVIGSLANGGRSTSSSGSVQSAGAGSGSSKANESTGSNAKPAVAPASLPKIGDTVEVGSWQVTVEDAKKSKELTWSEFGNKSTAKGTFVVLYVTARNKTQKTDSVNSFDYKLVDSAGAEYSVSTDSFMAASYNKRDSFMNEVPPRTETKLLAVFDVASDAQGLVLVIENQAKIAIGSVAGQ